MNPEKFCGLPLDELKANYDHFLEDLKQESGDFNDHITRYIEMQAGRMNDGRFNERELKTYYMMCIQSLIEIRGQFRILCKAIEFNMDYEIMASFNKHDKELQEAIHGTSKD